MDSKSEERECTAMQKVENVGSSFTSSVANCQQLATDLGLTNLTPSEVAEILVMMVMESDPQKTPLSFTDWLEDKPTGEKWHPEIFAEVLNQVSPDLDWKEVISSFDMPSFSVKSRGCLSALMSVLSVGLQNESFPVKVLYKRWTNSEAQPRFMDT
uniref:Uncharacterized protein n=1 Tax=Trichuris muris TaxID=70415 RepID=A0A5S6Q9N1_TRIMR